MSVCKQNQEILDDWIAGTGSLDEFDRSHAVHCERCRRAEDKARSLRLWLGTWTEEIDAEIDRLSVRALLQQHRRPPLYRRMAPWLAVAAAVVLAVLVFPTLGPDPVSPALGNYVSSLESEATRTELVSFLAKSQLFLLSLLDQSSADCAEDPAFQGRLAHRLIDQKRLLEPKLSDNAFSDIRPVLDELEVLLLTVADRDTCFQDEELRQWQGIIEARSTLLRLNLLQLEDRI